VLSAALLVTLSSCTLVAPLTTASAIGTHNTFTDDQNDWHYTTPVIVSAVVGLVFDIGFIMMMKSQWSKPMT
jgi:hypothetical protein